MLKMANSFPEEVLEHVFSFIQSDSDRNSISMVCKSWYEIERWCRRRIFIGNCYAVSPRMMIRRFPDIRSIELKGKPHFADFNLVPEGWGGYVHPWIAAMADAYPWLEEIKLKRMVVTDETLELIAKSFKKLLVLGERADAPSEDLNLSAQTRSARAILRGDAQSVQVSVKHFGKSLQCHLAKPDCAFYGIAPQGACLTVIFQFFIPGSHQMDKSISLHCRLPVLDQGSG